MPLQELEEEDKVLHVPSYVPASMEQVCDIISKQPGIDSLRLGRQVSFLAHLASCLRQCK